MKQLYGKLVYKAHVDGSYTVEQQIEQAKHDALTHGRCLESKKFEQSLKYDVTRTVANILSNASIKYRGSQTPLTESLQRYLVEIFFQIHDFGSVRLKLDENLRITSIGQTGGTVEIIDSSFKITGITQKDAADKAMDMYGVVTDSMFSCIDERGMLGMFSPATGVEIKKSQAETFYNAFKKVFGTKKGQRKVGIAEIPLTYSGVALPIKDMELLQNKKDATATVARIYGIQEDMILSGSTFDNKENAIIQTYSDFKGLIYGWINQICTNTITFTSAQDYEVTFEGVPQLQAKQKTPQ